MVLIIEILVGPFTCQLTRRMGTRMRGSGSAISSISGKFHFFFAPKSRPNIQHFKTWNFFTCFFFWVFFAVLRIRTRDPVPFWPLDPGWVTETIFSVKILICGCGSGSGIRESFLTLYPGRKKFGSGINISGPQHCIFACLDPDQSGSERQTARWWFIFTTWQYFTVLRRILNGRRWFRIRPKAAWLNLRVLN